MKKDIFVMGAIAGDSGAIAQMVYGQIGKVLHLTDRTFNDFAKVLIMYKEFSGPLGNVVGIIAHLSVNALFGVLFALFIQQANTNYYYVKGLGLGSSLWLFLSITGTIMNLPKFKEIPPNAALYTFGGALLWGLITALVYRLVNPIMDSSWKRE